MRLHTEKFDKLVVAVIAFSFILRIYLSLSSVPLNGVETVHPNIIRYMAEIKAIPLFTPLPPTADLFHYTPLFHIIAAVFYGIFSKISYGAAEFSIKMLSPIFALLTMVLIYLISIKLFDSKKIGFYAVLFFAFMPLSISLSTYMTLDNEFAFFTLLSFYMIIANHPMLAGVSFGLAYNTKILTLLYLPFLIVTLYLKFKGKLFMKQLFAFGTIALLLMMPWMIRNTILLHNPVYPMLNGIFHGYQNQVLDDTFNKGGTIYNFDAMNFPAKFFFGIFGFPEENKDIEFTYYGISQETVGHLIKIDMPLVVLLFNVWALAIVLFSLPLILGIYYLFKHHHEFVFYFFIILISGSLIHVIFIYLAADTATRYYSPVLPFLALVWAYGLVNLIPHTLFQKSLVKKFGKLLIIAILLGFMATESYKVRLLSFGVHKYDPMFLWINTYIPDDAYIYKVSGVIAYYTGNYYTDSVEKIKEMKGYIITQERYQTYGSPLYVPSEVPREIEEYKEIYADEKSGVRIYRVS